MDVECIKTIQIFAKKVATMLRNNGNLFFCCKNLTCNISWYRTCKDRQYNPEWFRRTLIRSEALEWKLYFKNDVSTLHPISGTKDSLLCKNLCFMRRKFSTLIQNKCYLINRMKWSWKVWRNCEYNHTYNICNVPECNYVKQLKCFI
jgi:hypothetical protein